jgi:hypothetical protein
MRTRKRLTILGTAAAVGALVLSGVSATSAVASPHWRHSYTCTGGHITGNDLTTATFSSIPSGTYSNITVKGICNVQAGAVINVVGNVDVEPGAWLDAQSEPSTITVGHNVTADRGAFVGLGCQPDYVDSQGKPVKTGHPCSADNANGHSTITINGSVRAFDAGLFLLNGVTVERNVTFIGGGNEMIPWVVKNNTIGGNLTVRGLTVEFFGVLFNSVGRNVRLSHITLHDVDPGAPGVYIVRNTIGRNLFCAGLTPGVTAGFPGEVNVIGGQEFGQCANLAVL